MTGETMVVGDSLLKAGERRNDEPIPVMSEAA
jgi:hypothetical protein